MNSFILISSKPANFQVGLNSFDISQFGFEFNKTSLMLTSTGLYNSLNISGWNFRKRSCDISTPYFCPTNLCYDTCPSTYYNIISGSVKYCKLCS
jgi:hypothetical protein